MNKIRYYVTTLPGMPAVVQSIQNAEGKVVADRCFHTDTDSDGWWFTAATFRIVGHDLIVRPLRCKGEAQKIFGRPIPEEDIPAEYLRP